MATDNLKLTKIDGQINATIDNQSCPLDIWEIDKFKTQIYNKSSINTVLNAPINLNLNLVYIEDNQTYNIEKGVVSVQITSLSKQTQYLDTIIDFTNGIVKTQLPNQLPLGEYLLHIQYDGSKYYESTQLTLQFSVNKRIAKCVFDDTLFEGYPDEVINIGVTIIDDRNEQKISNCLINYIFNGYSHTTSTNDNGYAVLTVTLPSVSSINCRHNLKYPLELYTDNISYELSKETYIDVLLKHYDTGINYNIIPHEDNKIDIQGSVIAQKKDGSLANVNYGTINFKIDEIANSEQSNISVDTNGRFEITNILVDITASNNKPVSSSVPCFSQQKETKTTVTILNDIPITRSYVKEHHIGFKAQVTSADKAVQYGMITFLITQNEEEVYRYITQVSMNGDAYFYFNMSTLGDYKVKAEYYGMFEYQASQSEKVAYTIMDDNNDMD